MPTQPVNFLMLLVYIYKMQKLILNVGGASVGTEPLDGAGREFSIVMNASGLQVRVECLTTS